MSPSRPPFGPAARGGLSSLLLLTVPLLLGADDDFLREIEDQARRQAATLVTNSPTVPLVPDTGADRLETELDPAAFEQALRRSLPGTYTIYQQLNTKRKQQLYQAYQSDNRLTNISERAAQLLSGKP
ncbi:MAG: hypothetical protein P9F19_02635 [Candidatus Contendobacter sp.]|nr:hypothetical protein [Candidatus Contendobacter sp.]MDG4556285.1 hypothetical protein [Candidatus Contendobacter sp.]